MNDLNSKGGFGVCTRGSNQPYGRASERCFGLDTSWDLGLMPLGTWDLLNTKVEFVTTCIVIYIWTIISAVNTKSRLDTME